MDIVDINCVINKFIKKLVIRHLSYVANMSLILSLDYNYINQYTTSVTNTYNTLLNVKKLSIVVKCIQNNIKVKLIFYKMNYDDINLIITTSFDCGNK